MARAVQAAKTPAVARRTRVATLLAAIVAAAAPADAIAQPASRNARAEIGSPSGPQRNRAPSRAVDTSPKIEAPLRAVRVEGNVTIPSSEILVYAHARVGRRVSQKQIRDDQARILATKWFSDVQPRVEAEGDGIAVVFVVTEKPILRRVAYIGNKKIGERYLTALTGLRPGHAYDVLINKEAVRRIRQYYQGRGYLDVEVTLEKGGEPDHREAVFRIDEGSKVKVYDIRFRGNKIASGARLKTQIQTQETWFWGLFRGDYDPNSIENDLAVLTRYYHNLGYFDVAIRDEVEKVGGRVTVTFHIEEGPRYEVRSVEYAGNFVLNDETLSADRKLDPGDTFDRRRLDEDTTKMREAYGRLGRLYASVEPVPRFTETPGIVDLVYEIDEDRVYYIRNVNVDIGGEAPHTKTNVVRNTMLLHPGDLANPKLLQRSRSRLEGSPAFSRQAGGGVQIDVQKVDDARVAGALPSVRGQSFVGPEHPAGHRPRRHGDVHVTFMVEPDAAEDPRFPVGPASRRPTASRRNFEPAGPQIRGQNASVYRDGNPFVAEEIPSPFVRQPNPFEQPAAPAFNRQANPFAAVDNAARGTTPQITRPVRGTAGQAAPPVTNAALTRPAPTTPAAAPTAAAPTVTAEANTQLVGRNPYTIRQAGATGPFAQANPLFGDQADDPDPLGTFGGDPPGFVDVNVNANEGQTGRFMFGASVNSNAGLLGNIVLEEQNFDLFAFPRSFGDISRGNAFRGGGQRFRLEATPGSDVSRYLVNWTDPFFLDSVYSLGVSGFYYTRFFEEYDEQRLGGRINVGRNWNPYFSTGFTVRLENVELDDPVVPTPAILAEDLGDNFLFTLGVNARYDTRDSAINPSDGFLGEISYEQGLADSVYPRIEATGTNYYTLYSRPDGSGKQILTTRGQIGWSGEDVPFFERFFAGGFQTFRGFDFRGVGPREFGAAIGGRFLLLGTVEYRLPITANDALSAVVFSDFGTVEEDVEIETFRVTVGAGARIQVAALGPVPLAFDFAVPLNDADFDDRELFSFYVGVQR